MSPRFRSRRMVSIDTPSCPAASRSVHGRRGGDTTSSISVRRLGLAQRPFVRVCRVVRAGRDPEERKRLAQVRGRVNLEKVHLGFWAAPPSHAWRRRGWSGLSFSG